MFYFTIKIFSSIPRFSTTCFTWRNLQEILIYEKLVKIKSFKYFFPSTSKLKVKKIQQCRKCYSKYLPFKIFHFLIHERYKNEQKNDEQHVQQQQKHVCEWREGKRVLFFITKTNLRKCQWRRQIKTSSK